MSFRTMVQEESVDGVTFRVHRLVKKKLMGGSGGDVQYSMQPTDSHQLEIVLNNASVLIEPGALQYSYGSLRAEVIRHENKGFFARQMASAATGESAHATKYSGSGTIWCEPVHKEFVIATMDGPQDALLLDDQAFYACSADIQLSTHLHKSIAGMFSGNGLAQPKLTGRGVFAVESPVPVDEIDVIEAKPGEEIVVDGDFMLMYSESLQVELGPLVSGIRNAMRSGEGFVYKLRGQGMVYLTPTSKVV